MSAIYKHTDPVTRIVRYIGKTSKAPQQRLKAHLSEARTGKRNYRLNWLRSLDRLPIVEVLEYVQGEALSDREKYWIALFRDYGHDLVNATEGGEGLSNPSSETRAKIVASKIGRKHSKEARDKMSRAAVGRRPTAAHRAAISASLIGIPKTKACRVAISTAQKGVPETEACCAAMRLRQVGKKHNKSSSRFHYVYWDKTTQSWKVQVLRKALGRFLDEIEAARAADAYIRANNLSPKLLNFP